MKDKLLEESLEDVNVSFEMERKSEAGIAKNVSIDEDDSESSYESYVPDSLRDFLKAADAQLEADLSFLSPPAKVLAAGQGDDVMLGGHTMDDEDEGHSILADTLEQEMQRARQKDMERETAMAKEAADRKEREQKQRDQHDLELKRQQEQQQQQQAEEFAKTQASMILDDDDEDDEANEVASPLLNVVHPMADVTESHVKRIAMEGADDDDDMPELVTEEEVAEEPMPGMATTNHLPSPTIDSNMAALANGGTAFSPSPMKVGRKLQMELDAEAHRASLSAEAKEKDNNQNNISIHSAKSALEEKQQSVREKQERLKELQSRSVERKRRLKELHDRSEEKNSAEIVLQKDSPIVTETQPAPSTAAANAANKAAAVADKAEPKARKNLTGPVKALPPHMRPKNTQKWSFRAREAPSPPRPKEININVNHAEDGRSVSPLGHEQVPVSPLGSPQTKRAPVRRYERSQPKRASPSKRRQLTQPNSAFDSISRPTVSSSKGRMGDSRKAAKINPEEEQRKARERVRQRMAAQRRTARNEKTSSTASEKAKARRERIEKMEQERVAKLKAKIAEREERTKQIQARKKEEEAKKKLQQEKKTTTQQRKPENESKTKRPTPNRELTIPVAPKFATDRRSTATKPPVKKERLSLASITQQFDKGLRSSTPPPIRSTTPEPRRLTIPVAPKFITDRRSTAKKPPLRKERLSLASSTQLFDKGLRSATPPPIRNATPEPRRLTIPMAPKFVTSQRLGEKTNPISSPSRKGREPSDNMSWSSSLRDVSAIASPLSKAASSIKTGPLTIPITPQFQPIRKRPLPKSTAEREEEEMKYFQEHKFKSKLVKTKEPLKKSVKKTPAQQKPLTTPEPFHFHTTRSKNSHTKSDPEPSVEKFKARPMPNFKKSNRTSFGSRVKSPRSLTSPEPFHFHSTSSKHSHTKSEEERIDTQFKPLPMPDFKKAHRNSLGSKKLKSPPTRPIPFNFHGANTHRSPIETQKKEEEKLFKARPMPNFDKVSPITEKEMQRAKSRKSIGRPTGASGLLFHRTLPKEDIKLFKARPMPDFIPEVIVTRTPIRDAGEEEPPKSNSGKNMEEDLDNILSDVEKFQARRTPDANKFSPMREKLTQQLHVISPRTKNEEDESLMFKARPAPKNMLDEPKIPVRQRDPTKLRNTPSPSNKTKEDELESSFVFKASPVPKNILDDPKIPVRKRDPSKLRSPDSVKRPNTPERTPLSSNFKARPLYGEKTPLSRSNASPIRKLGSPDRISVPSPSRRNKLGPSVDGNSANSSITNSISNSMGNSTSTGNVMEEAKARMRERLSQRKANSAAVKAATPNRDKSKLDKSPLAFSTLRVKSLLDTQTAKQEKELRKESPKHKSFEETPRKSNSTVPKSIDLPSGEKPAKAETPKIKNNNVGGSPGETSSFHTADEATYQIPHPPDPKEAALERETKLALALGRPDGDESSSILQLARDVQRAAEDELSFYGSVDTRDHWSSSLADGKPHSLLDN